MMHTVYEFIVFSFIGGMTQTTRQQLTRFYLRSKDSFRNFQKVISRVSFGIKRNMYLIGILSSCKFYFTTLCQRERRKDKLVEDQLKQRKKQCKIRVSSQTKQKDQIIIL